MKTIHICEGCGEQFDKADDALACENRQKPKVALKVGDIVVGVKSYGWLDGDPEWIANRKLHGRARAESGYRASQCRYPGTNCFASCCCYDFLYVITAIDEHEHRTRYHLQTRALRGGAGKGHSGGYTYDWGHYKPKRVPPSRVPEKVAKQARRMRGTVGNLL